jgi:excinuclease UvrABC ATPase subunit
MNEVKIKGSANTSLSWKSVKFSLTEATMVLLYWSKSSASSSLSSHTLWHSWAHRRAMFSSLPLYSFGYDYITFWMILAKSRMLNW